MNIIKARKLPKPEVGSVFTDKSGIPIGIVLSHAEDDISLVAVTQDTEEIQELKEEDVKQHCQIHKEDPEFIKKLKEAKVKACLQERAKLIKAKKDYYNAVGWADDYK